jgi:hypothetical protein
MPFNPDDPSLVLVEKDGEQIRVHPFTLANHLELGWKIVQISAENVSTETPVVPAALQAEKQPARKPKQTP